MKRIGRIFERIIEPDNLRLAFWKASRGKRLRPDQREWQENLEGRIAELREGLELKQAPFINRTAAGMEFLGMRVYRDTVHLSRRSRVRYGRKVRAYERLFEAGRWDEGELQRRVTSLTAFTAGADAAVWRRHNLAVREGLRAITVCCAAGAGTTPRTTAAPRTATGTIPATATTTTASASFAPQHRRTEVRAVPADGPIPNEGQIQTSEPALVAESKVPARNSNGAVEKPAQSRTGRSPSLPKRTSCAAFAQLREGRAPSQPGSSTAANA